MKVLRIILVLVALLVLLVVGIGLMGPTEMSVSHTKTVNAPIDAVFNQVENLKNWPNWSPWYEADPGMKLTYSEGDATGEGAWYSWDGEKSGKGKLEIREVVGQEKIGMDIGFDMGEGLEYSTCDMMFKKQEGVTEVTWMFNSSSSTGFMNRIMNVILPSMLKGQYETGLNNLETAAKNNPYTKPETKPLAEGMRIQDMDGFYYIGKRFTDKKIEDISSEDYSTSYGQIFGYLGSIKAMDKVVQPPIALTEIYNRETTVSTFVVAMKTTEKLAPSEDLLTDYYKSHKAMTYAHVGSYESLPESYTKIMETIRAKELTPLFPTYEVYMTDPQEEPDMTKWETLVVVPIEWTE